MGVTQLPNGKFRARYEKDGKRISVGVYKSESEAKRRLASHRQSTQQEVLSDDDITADEMKGLFGSGSAQKPTPKKRSFLDRLLRRG